MIQTNSNPSARPIEKTTDKDLYSALPLLPAAKLGTSHWLLHLRSVAIVGQLLTIVFAGWITGVPLRLVPLLGLVGLTAATNALYAIWLRGNSAAAKPIDVEPDDREDLAVKSVALGLMVLDLVTLTAMLYFSGGAGNPFSFFYFVNLAVGGVMIRPRSAWILTVVATIGYAFVLRWHVQLPGISLQAPNGFLGVRVIGLMLAFGTCATVVTYFVTLTAGLLRQRERQLRDQERASAADRRLEALTTLAAGAAHELATPLSTIDVVARELMRHLDDIKKPATVDEDLQLIDHQLEICRQILQRMRGAAGDSMAQRWQKTTVGDLIDATLEGVRDPHRVDVVDGADIVEQQTLWVPEEAVAQAIRNLIHNGLDASGFEGRVRVESKLEDQDVRIIVSDQGEGMDDTVLGRVGDPFFTTKEPGRGIGLGLYLTRNVVSQLGGTLNFNSQPNEGTAAVVTLPISKPRDAE
ncbi:MAG: ATP-binding protein [Planctomycetota bacterium]